MSLYVVFAFGLILAHGAAVITEFIMEVKQHIRVWWPYFMGVCCAVRFGPADKFSPSPFLRWGRYRLPL